MFLKAILHLTKLFCTNRTKYCKAQITINASTGPTTGFHYSVKRVMRHMIPWTLVFHTIATVLWIMLEGYWLGTLHKIFLEHLGPRHRLKRPTFWETSINVWTKPKSLQLFNRILEQVISREERLRDSPIAVQDVPRNRLHLLLHEPDTSQQLEYHHYTAPNDFASWCLQNIKLDAFFIKLHN